MHRAIWIAIACGLTGCGGKSYSPDPSPPRAPLAATPPIASAPAPPSAPAASPTGTASAEPAEPPPKRPTVDLRGIWGSDAKNIWVVGDKGTILRGDGATWEEVTSPTTAKLRSVTGTDASHAWAAGEHTILAWDGTAWQVSKQDVPDELIVVLAIDASHVFAVGRGGSIWMWDGAAWSEQRQTKNGELLSIAGEDLAHLYAVGEAALFLQFDGKKGWQKRKSPPSYGAKFGPGNDGSFVDVDFHSTFTRAYVRSGHMFLSNSAGYVVEGTPGGAWKLTLPGNPSDEWGIYGFWGTDPGRMWFVTSEFIAWRETAGPWKTCNSPLFYAVWGTDKDNVWAAGSGGLLVKLDSTVLLEGKTCNLPEGGTWEYRH